MARNKVVVTVNQVNTTVIDIGDISIVFFEKYIAPHLAAMDTDEGWSFSDFAHDETWEVGEIEVKPV